MHGQYCRLTEQPPVDMKETYGWLKAANLPAATEGLVVAAQDQALRTRSYERKILHRDVSPTCCMCSVGLEMVDHIVAGFSALAPINLCTCMHLITDFVLQTLIVFTACLCYTVCV